MWVPYLLPLLAVLGHCADKILDEVAFLPGQTFEVKFKHYSGFLDASQGNHLHYWFFESQSTPSTDPLILWLNGSPFSDTTSSPLKENGPFHPTRDGEHLQENVFSWNKISNVLFIDSPVCTGFSYMDGPKSVRNNSKTTEDLVLALKSFVAAYPQLQYRDFYVAGELYGGIYVPLLVNELINTDSVRLVLKGFAIGNGLLKSSDSFNSNIDLLYYRGIISKDEFDDLNDCCKSSGQTTDLLYCDFSYFIDIATDGRISPKTFTDQTLQKCAEKVNKLGNDKVFSTKNSPFNLNQDCYENQSNTPSIISTAAKSYQNHENDFYDQGANQFADSTDAMNGFPCYVDDASDKYLNLPEVRQALHIDKQPTAQCGDYVQNDWDMTEVFNSIINSGAPIRGLIYNGDLDLTSSFLADQWFVERIADSQKLNVVAERAEWIYKRSSAFPPIGAGYVKRFGKNVFTIDMVQVKGAGLFATMDRPGPALQMINNFIAGLKYDHTDNISTDPAPLLKEYQSAPEPELSRKESDRIFDLPGVTFNVNFNQYAGYLNGIKGNYLHYWFVESQRNPEKDPLVMWLSGGPGCSGYTALMWGNGPFRANRDGSTLYENIYSWNKIANVIFIDSPRGVGYSFQNTTENPSKEWNDDLTAEDLKLAILDFLEVYPEYKNRPFYLTGESYGGIYVPSTAAKLIDMITTGDLPYLNFKGIATANAMLSRNDDFNSLIQYQYFHGGIGKDDWDSLQQCCKKSDHPDDPAYFEFCDFASAYITFDDHGMATPKNPNDICAQKTINISVNSVWNSPQSTYNLYASCYEIPNFGNDRPELIEPYYKKGFIDQARLVSHEATGNQDGQFCWGMLGVRNYLNTEAVQAALHVRIPENKKPVPWMGCSDVVGNSYKSQYFDMRPFFDKMITWGKPFKILIYNGDIDITCNFLSDQWFAESVAKKYDMKLTKKYSDWLYLSQVGGYSEQFAYKDVTMDFITVKGAGHFCALDRPGPTLQVFSSFIDDKPLNKEVTADLKKNDLLQRYSVEEVVGRQKDLSSSATRAKRSAVAAGKGLPDPPPACSKKDNEVIDLPGLTFDLGVRHYSGYVSAGTGEYLHYWLIEAATDHTNAPLVLWFNGGPGCSSLTGLFSELGPFQNNADGETLYENVFSWHKAGNLLFLEAPRGVGFSYQASNSDASTVHDYSDDETAAGNVAALVSFLECYPEFKNRKIFITGESYAGIYIPTFVDLLLKKVLDGSVTGVNLEGVAIGNGELSAIKSLNSDLSLTYFRGMHSRKDFEALGECVTPDHDGPMSTFDFSTYVHIAETGGAPIPKSFNPETVEGRCALEIIKQSYEDVWLSGNDVYNTYQDCYVDRGNKDAANVGQDKSKRVKRDAIGRPMSYTPFVDEAKRMNYDSTDNNHGVYCYDGKTPYLNRPDVRKAIHISEHFTEKWEECTQTVQLHYKQQHNDTTPVFESIFATLNTLKKPLRFLIYHGNADMACQFLSGQWFIEALATKNQMEMTKAYTPWDYQQKENSMMRNIGGHQKSWSHMEGLVTIDLLTVKGAGHMVQMDRPGEALQMFYNFVHNSKQTKNPVDYNIPLWKSIDNVNRKPLKAEYFTAPSSMVSRADADRIYDLPGLTYDYAFDQWSGYLQAGKGDKLFYWFFESQNADPSAPVVLWLNGGPGCSSLIGLFTENGPFRVNPDQRTLWENVYSWNKAAHVLYIDSPKKVGFSYQNMTENPKQTTSDDDIAPDAWLALEDFFTIYPDMKKRDFYTSGESYCGVYLPLITTYLAQKIESKQSAINLKGMIIGNGEVSFKQDMRTMPSYNYMHGIIDKNKYDSLSDCCTGEDAVGGLYCHYDDFFESVITWTPKKDLDATGKACVKALFAITAAEGEEWSDTNDAYNLYQDCYANPKSLFSSTNIKSSYKSRILAMRDRAKRAAAHAAKYGMELDTIDWGNLDPLSTDNTNGYQCWMDDATIAYLNKPHVRTALHVPDYVQAWDECANILYKTLYEDMSEQFEYLMNSPLDLRVLLYNGDIDDVCQLQQAQWFVETLAHKHGWTESEKTEWNYRGAIAGYQTSYKTNKKFSLDLLTVKGAGHMVPTDRPGPALQMVDAFLKNKDYNTPVPYSMERKPLLPQYNRKGEGCDDDFQQMGDHCYQLSDSFSSFSDAESSCSSKGGHLASIHNDDTNTFIESLASGTPIGVFIGLKKGQKDFEWTDGTPLDYTNGHLDAFGGDCVIFGSLTGSWSNSDCDFAFKFICEKNVN